MHTADMKKAARLKLRGEHKLTQSLVCLGLTYNEARDVLRIVKGTVWLRPREKFLKTCRSNRAKP